MRALAAILLSILVASGAVFLAVGAYLDRPLSISEPQTIDVPRGTGMSSLAQSLADQQILMRPWLLSLIARIDGSAGSIKAGEYQLLPGDTPKVLLGKLVDGKVVHYPITFIEGWTMREVWVELAKHDKLNRSLAEADEVKLRALLDIDVPSLEGQFYPDTYTYTATTTDLELLRRAHRRLQQVLEEEWRNRSIGLPYSTSYEALTMASIIEKETGMAAERAEIAGVFIRRLHKRMRLQTDPTVIFGLGPDYQGNLTRTQLSTRTPYNTYVIKGLPPGPIALAGKEAISAALHPEEGSSLYFVAKGDGSHVFSDTLKEHNAAVHYYQVSNRDPNYRSAPTRN